MRVTAAALLAAALLAGGRPAGAAPPVGEQEYVYVEDTSRRVGLLRGELIFLGFLDKAGTFTADPHYAPLRLRGGGSAPRHTLLNGSPGTAYEYRSGRLILGEIDQDGTFVPALGSKVIAFEQYRPGGNAPPIYNLPGRFVKKGEEKALREELEKLKEKRRISDKLEELEEQRLEKEKKEELERQKKEVERQKPKDKP